MVTRMNDEGILIAPLFFERMKHLRKPLSFPALWATLIGLCGYSPTVAAEPNLASDPTVNQIVYLSGTGSDDTIDWDFLCTGGRQSGYWTTIPVPSNWEVQGFGSYNYGHDRPRSDEKGKYRHQFSIPEGWTDRRIRIVFEGSMTDTEVRINGQTAGPEHQGGFYQFHYDITDLLDFEKPNLLEVTVSKVSANRSVERAERFGDYWIFGGIYRPVFLEARPAEYIDWTAIDARADGEFTMDVHLGPARSADSIALELHDQEGNLIAEGVSQTIRNDGGTVAIRARAPNINPWSAEAPALYYATVRLKRGNHTLHQVRERFGFRTIEVREGDGIYLNGQKLLFKGVNRHCFWPDTGRTLNRQISYDDARLIKEMNMNAVRMAHYPPDKHFLEAADELGLYVINELAGWHDAYDTAVGKRLVEQMVRRDVNHPSILFWANGNEGGHNFELVKEYGRHDPQNRVVIHPTPSWESPSLFNSIDTAHYPPYDDHLRRLNGPNIYLPTEFMHALYDGGGGAALYDYWTAIKDSPIGAGGFIWALIDEGVVRTDQNGRIDSDGNHAPDGIVSPYREKSGSFYTIKELWSPVQLTLPKLDSEFDGRLALTNEYAFTNLAECRFEWKWADFADPRETPAGYVVRHTGSVGGPDVAPGSDGVLHIDVPRDWRERDLLYLTAFDPNGAELFTWSQAIRTPSEYRASIVQTGGGSLLALEQDDILTLSAGRSTLRFDLGSGRLLEAHRDGRPFSFGNGPRFVPSRLVTNSIPVLSVRAGSEQHPNRAVHVADGNPTSRWSAQGDTAWVILDLGQPTEIGEIEVHWQNGEARAFRFVIETSPDNAAWTTAFSGQSNGHTPSEIYSWPTQTARFLRLVGQGNTENAWTSIHQIRVLDRSRDRPIISHGRADGSYHLSAQTDRSAFRWTVDPSGWFRLDYRFEASDVFDFAGITFDYPEEQVLAKDWIGAGPYRVWKNRMHGTRIGSFANLYNDPIPGQSWAVPEFKGYFAHLYRLGLTTREGKLTVLTDTPDLLARIHSPHFGPDPMSARSIMPPGDISFLHAIPAIGTKFRATHQLGPGSQPTKIEGTRQGTLYFHLGELAL